MNTKRLFIGTFIDRDVFKYSYEDIIEDFKMAVFGKWVEIENLHFTFKFLGDVKMQEITKIKEELDDLFTDIESPLIFNGLGGFPNLINPRVLFANIIDNSGQLEFINNSIEKRLFNLGFPADNKPFKPHLTLIRLKDFNKFEFKNAVSKYKDYEFGEMDSFKPVLIESKLTPKGPIYSVV